MIKIITNFKDFKKCLTEPVNEGRFTVNYSMSDTMTVAEYMSLNSSKAEINMVNEEEDGQDDFTRMLMLGQMLGSEGSFIYITDNEHLLARKRYGSEESHIIFVSDIMEAIKLSQPSAKNKTQKKTSRKPAPKTKKSEDVVESVKTEEKQQETPAEQVEVQTEQPQAEPAPVKEPEMEEQVVEKTVKDDVIPEVKEEPVKEIEPTPEEVKTEVKPVEVEKTEEPKSELEIKKETDIKVTEPVATPVQATKKKVTRRPANTAKKAQKEKPAEVSAKIEKASFLTPQHIIDKLAEIDKGFANYPDHIISGIRESDEASDLNFNLKFLLDPKLLDNTTKKLRPHFDELKPLADNTRISVTTVYKADGTVEK